MLVVFPIFVRRAHPLPRAATTISRIKRMHSDAQFEMKMRVNWLLNRVNLHQNVLPD